MPRTRYYEDCAHRIAPDMESYLPNVAVPTLCHVCFLEETQAINEHYQAKRQALSDMGAIWQKLNGEENNPRPEYTRERFQLTGLLFIFTNSLRDERIDLFTRAVQGEDIDLEWTAYEIKNIEFMDAVRQEMSVVQDLAAIAIVGAMVEAMVDE